jgi:hypothetical protein
MLTLMWHSLTVLVFLYLKNITENRMILFIAIGVFFGWLLFFALPVFVLYFNHTRHSSNVVFQIEDEIYTIKSKNNSIIINANDIKKVELWLTPPAYDKRIDWLFFGKYHYTKIYTKQNQEINISCLVFDETEKIFPEELIERKKKLLPLMGKVFGRAIN